jgi:hypothetical protein
VNVQYAKSGDVNIAYQVTGEGPFDLVFVPGYVAHLELHWAIPSFAPFPRAAVVVFAADPIRQAGNRHVRRRQWCADTGDTDG